MEVAISRLQSAKCEIPVLKQDTLCTAWFDDFVPVHGIFESFLGSLNHEGRAHVAVVTSHVCQPGNPNMATERCLGQQGVEPKNARYTSAQGRLAACYLAGWRQRRILLMLLAWQGMSSSEYQK